MQKLYNDKITISYENNMMGNYILFNLSEDERVIDYQQKMIQNNPSACFVPFSIKMKNAKVFISYEVTSKLPVSQLIKKNRPTGKDVIRMLKNLSEAVSECVKYLLDEKNILLHEDFVFINPDNLNVSLIYIPVNLDTDFCGSFKRFTLKLINSSNQSEKYEDALLDKILTYIKESDFDIRSFNRILEEIEKQKMSKNTELFTEDNVENFKISIPKINNTEKLPENFGYLKEKEHKKYGLNLRISERRSVLIILLLLQAVIVISSALLYQLTAQEDFSTFLGILIIAFAGDFFAVRYVLKRKQTNLLNLIKGESGK